MNFNIVQTLLVNGCSTKHLLNSFLLYMNSKVANEMYYASFTYIY